MSRKANQSPNLTKILIAMIAALSVILVVVICIAVSTHSPQGMPSTDNSSSSENQGSDEVPAVDLQVQPLSNITGFVALEKLQFSGVSDPALPLTVNGSEVTRSADGTFTCEVTLTVGQNEIVFASGQQTKVFQVERKMLTASVAPAGDQTFSSGTTVSMEVIAKAESQVTASFHGKEITLTKAESQQDKEVPEGFAIFVGQYKLPSDNTSDLDLGVITFTVTCDGVTETNTSGKITCLKVPSNPVTNTGPYLNVGTGYIAEIVANTAETFDGKTKDDYSHPTNNYLPKGTVDYCSPQMVKPSAGSQLEYALLRYGMRTYTTKKNQPSSQRVQVTKCYYGTLPDHNEIGIYSLQTVGNHTVLTLDTMWKAPFYFDVLPQQYAAPNAGSDRSYVISSFTVTHIDITLCYTTKVTGTVNIPGDNPLFKSAEIIQNEKDCILRLHLKETGGFYGWDCHYNDEGQLVFEFLNPAKVTATDANTYGADLTGVTVMLDVGHGGDDGGATGVYDGQRWSESGRNMDLAYAVQTELEKMGATVLFNREGKVTLTVDERINIVKDSKADLCIAIHHNSLGEGYEYYNGFEGYYYTPFSQLAATKIYQQTKASGVYKSSSISWHNYYVARQTLCPVVLMENGYMSNEYDLGNALDATAIAKKAAAVAQGVADYFLEINK